MLVLNKGIGLQILNSTCHSVVAENGRMGSRRDRVHLLVGGG